ncbi:hypothetical protein ABVK25_004191 [Lepraria finkii]|uniref:Uncharacterized protein n=1 Tax=Lepraria finkii TaxID=1340010 RepID=A0ABR4BD71_9LECA
MGSRSQYRRKYNPFDLFLTANYVANKATRLLEPAARCFFRAVVIGNGQRQGMVLVETLSSGVYHAIKSCTHRLGEGTRVMLTNPLAQTIKLQTEIAPPIPSGTRYRYLRPSFPRLLYQHH